MTAAGSEGWLAAERTEQVAADQILAGDILVFDDGAEAEIADVRTVAEVWLNTGRHSPA